MLSSKLDEKVALENTFHITQIHGIVIIPCYICISTNTNTQPQQNGKVAATRALGGANRHVIQSVKLKAYVDEEVPGWKRRGVEKKDAATDKCAQMLGGRVLLKIDAIKF